MQITVEGRQVNVDDSFAKLPRDQQDATVDEIAKSLPRSEPPSSGVVAGAQKGLADLAQGVGSTLHTFTGSDPTGLEEKGKNAQPSNYQSPQLVPDGGHWYNPASYNWGAVPQMVAEAAPGMATDIAAAKVASKLPVVGKYAAVPAGIASYLLRTRGQAAKNDAVIRTGDQNAEPELQDKARSLLTGGAEAVPQALGIGRFLPGGAVSKTAGQALAKLGITAATEGGTSAAANAIGQAGSTVGTPGGLKVDPGQVVGSGVTGGIIGGAMGTPKAAAEAISAKKYAPLGGDNQAATEAIVNRVQAAPGGDNLSNTGDAYTALKTAHNAVKAELKAGIKPIKDQVDPDTLDALKRAGRGETLNDTDLQNIEENTSPDVAALARQSHVASLMKGMGDFGNGQFVGGAANAIGKHVWSIRNPVAAAIGAAGLNGGFEGMMAHSPEVLAAIGGTYMGLKGLDKLAGTRSPMASIAERFQNPDTPIRLPQPQAPQAPTGPTVGPTGPNVPFNPGVANGGIMLATGQSPWTPNPNAPVPAVSAKDLEPLVRGELQKFNALRKAAGARSAENLAASSPLVNDNGGLDMLKQPGFGDAAGKIVSAANAFKKLTAQPEEEQAAQPAAPKITKSNGKVRVEAPPLAAEAPYETVPDGELWRKGLTDQQVADRQLAEYAPQVRKKYAKNVMANRALKRDTMEDLANNANDADAPLMGHLYHRLDHVSRRGLARKEIDFWTAKMSPEGKQAVEARLAPLMSKLWTKE